MSAITLYPAIDIRGGRAVRLLKGDYDQETPYDADPVDAARRWVDGGAEILHVVDLDGARSGEPQNLETIRRITEAVDVPVQVGGGLRKRAAVEELLEAGAARAIVGTVAAERPSFAGRLVGKHGGERVVCAVDARGGKVAVEGWEKATTTTVGELIGQLAARHVRRFVYTPVEVDGTLEGPGLDGLADIAETCAKQGAELIYSGGVGSLEDLERLRDLGIPEITGVIVGRALYEERFTVAEAIAALGR